MQWTAVFPMFPADQLVPLAQAAEQAGFHWIAVPDSVFFPENVSADYPYTPDGDRFWAPDTPFVDPLVSIAAMAAVTTRIGFYTNVLKLPIRNPLLVAKQVSSLAVLTAGRLALGVGLSWIPEEFAWTGTEKRTRGARTDEAVEIIRAVCAGGGPRWVEHHGQHYDFDRLMISPAPDKPVPLWIGGHSEPALNRAARLGDGWISANVTSEEIARALQSLQEQRAELGRADEPFAVSVLATDAFDLDGYRRLADLGVTTIQCAPWYFYGGDPEAMATRRDAMFRFADDVIAKW